MTEKLKIKLSDGLPGGTYTKGNHTISVKTGEAVEVDVATAEKFLHDGTFVVAVGEDKKATVLKDEVAAAKPAETK